MHIRLAVTVMFDGNFSMHLSLSSSVTYSAHR